MLILIKEKPTKEDILKASEDIEGYIKFVVDIKNENLTIGGSRHYDGEQILLKNNSEQKNLWGGGYDINIKTIDYDSMINIRVKDNNPSREVLSMVIREKINKILNKKLKW